MTGLFLGDIEPEATWRALLASPRAVLIDVRSEPEWQFVGGPDLGAAGRQVLQVAWQIWPGMRPNPGFADEVAAAGITRDQPVYLICRSGVRSRAAALALAELGYTTYNVADGFEGPLGSDGRRSHRGWRSAGLPWRQS